MTILLELFDYENTQKRRRYPVISSVYSKEGHLLSVPGNGIPYHKYERKEGRREGGRRKGKEGRKRRSLCDKKHTQTYRHTHLYL